MLYSAVQQLKQGKFNSSNQYATTSFVQDALGNVSNATTITAASTTLTVAQAGQAFLFSTASASVILPTASGVTAGGTYKLHTSAGFTLSVTGGESMQAGNASITSLAVPAGTEVLAVSTGAAWWVFGTGALINSASFACVSAANGKQMLPSGILEQWGTYTYPNAVTAGTQYIVDITLPVAYSVAPFFHSVICQDFDAGVQKMAASIRYNGVLGKLQLVFSGSGSGSAGGTVFKWMAKGVV